MTISLNKRTSLPDLPVIHALCGLLLATSFLFGCTLAPTLLWGDDAMYQMALANSSLTVHPVWGALARGFALLPWGDYCFRANLASAIYGVVAVGFLFLATYAVSGSSRAALAAGAVLAFSHTFWLQAVRAEVYTLHLLFFFSGLWAFLRWRQATARWHWLALGFAVWLVGMVNHLLLGLAFPGALGLVMKAAQPSERKRILLLLACVLVVGALGVAFLVPGFFSDTLPGAVGAVVDEFSFSPYRLALHLVLLVYQFPLLGILAIPGVRYLWRRDSAVTVALGLTIVLTAAFASTFGIWESYVFYLPVHGLIALLVGLGVAAVTTHWSSRRWLLVLATVLGLQVGLYRLTPILVDRLAPGAIPARDLPGRPAAGFFLWPPKRGDRGAREFAETALDLLPADAILVADWTPYTALKYVQDVEGSRRDVLIVMPDAPGGQCMQVIQENRSVRPVFLADADPRYYPIAELEVWFRIEPVSLIFALIPWEETE